MCYFTQHHFRYTLFVCSRYPEPAALCNYRNVRSSMCLWRRNMRLQAFDSYAEYRDYLYSPEGSSYRLTDGGSPIEITHHHANTINGSLVFWSREVVDLLQQSPMIYVKTAPINFPNTLEATHVLLVSTIAEGHVSIVSVTTLVM